MSNKLIDIIDITKSYDENVILDKLNLYIRENEFLTLLGPSGCGKTTLISSLNKTADLTDGSIVLEGTDLSKISSKERAKLIAFLPQIRQVIPAIPVKTSD